MKFTQSLLVLALAAPTALRATTFQQVTDYGSNPGNVDMYYYIPDCLNGQTTGRPLVVALHYCTGTAFDMYAGAHDGPSFREMADKYGFVVVYPNVRNDPGTCWDVYSTASLTRYGGGESHSIANQVTYAISTWRLDARKVYAVGLSSGASMVNVLAALYPDKFAGGSVYAGVAYGCFAGTTIWNNECSTGARIKTSTEWGDLVRNAYYGYNGKRPKIQIWQNSPDEIFNYQNMEEQTKQWTNVFGYPTSPVSVSYGSPTTAWTRKIYGDRFQTVTSTIYAHIFPIQSQDTIEYFGLNHNVPTSCSNPATNCTTERKHREEAQEARKGREARKRGKHIQ